MLNIHDFSSTGTTASFRCLIFIVLVDFIFRIFVFWWWLWSNSSLYSRWHTSLSIHRFSGSVSNHCHSL